MDETSTYVQRYIKICDDISNTFDLMCSDNDILNLMMIFQNVSLIYVFGQAQYLKSAEKC